MTNQISSQLKQLQHRNILIVIFVLLFISIFIWTGLSIISSTTTSQLPVNITKLAAPLNPSIDRQALSEIEHKQVLSEEDLKSFPIYKIILDKRTNTEHVISIGTDETIFTQPAASTPTPTPNFSPQIEPDISPTPPNREINSQVSPTSAPTPTPIESQNE